MIILAACAALGASTTLKVGDRLDGYVLRILTPVKFVICAFDDTGKIPKPWKVFRLEGLTAPKPKSPGFRKGVEFVRSIVGPFDYIDYGDVKTGQPRSGQMGMCQFVVTGFDKNHTVVGKANYYRSEPSTDFQFRTWDESLDDALVKAGLATRTSHPPQPSTGNHRAPIGST